MEKGATIFHESLEYGKGGREKRRGNVGWSLRMSLSYYVCVFCLLYVLPQHCNSSDRWVAFYYPHTSTQTQSRHGWCIYFYLFCFAINKLLFKQTQSLHPFKPLTKLVLASTRISREDDFCLTVPAVSAILFVACVCFCRLASESSGILFVYKTQF